GRTREDGGGCLRRAAPCGDELDDEKERRGGEHELRADRESGVEVDVELLVDGEGERLRDALKRPGEHDRRPELAETPRERQRGPRPQPARGEGQRDTCERHTGPLPERARGI